MQLHCYRVSAFVKYILREMNCSYSFVLYCVWNVMAHAQKPYFVFRRNGRVRLNRQRPQLSRLLAAEVCASTVVMLDTPCSEVVWRVLDTHSICQFPLHFPSRTSLCAITFQLDFIISVVLLLLLLLFRLKFIQFKTYIATSRIYRDLRGFWT